MLPQRDTLPGPNAETASIAVVVVCFLPDVAHVTAMCAMIAGPDIAVYVVDNSPNSKIDEALLPGRCRVIAIGHNSGIGHAQNVGVAAAIRDGARQIAFFDQDSTVNRGLLSTLSSALKRGVPDIVAPACRDDASGRWLAAERLAPLGMTAVFPDGRTEPYEVDVIISSGTMATVEVFALAGLFDPTFFIDFVDSEWCLRCRRLGISIRVIPGAVMHHRIGGSSFSIAGRDLQVHSATRSYYQVRNALRLFRKDAVPFSYALRQAWIVASSRLLLLLHVREKRNYLKAYAAGLKDGLMGRGGSIEDRVAGTRPNPAKS